jgi:hypothetical protein
MRLRPSYALPFAFFCCALFAFVWLCVSIQRLNATVYRYIQVDTSGRSPTVVDLYNSGLGDEWLESSMGELKRFEHLEFRLDRSRVTDQGLSLLSGMKSIEVLSLDKTAITDESVATLMSLPSLRSLSIGATRITAAGLVKLSTLPLVSLSVDGAQLGGTSLESLQGLRQIPYVHVLNCSDALAPLLAGLGNKSFGLQGTQVTNKSLETLAAIDGLRMLRLVGTSVTREAVAEFSRRTGCQPHLYSDAQVEQERVKKDRPPVSMMNR